MSERWKPIDGWDGLYEVSSFGRVRSIGRRVRKRRWGSWKIEAVRVAPRIRKTSTVKGGYQQIQLYRNGTYFCRYVHVLVVQAFIRALRAGEEVNHVDGDTRNNRLTNLEITTHSGNMLHAVHVLGTVTPPTKK